MGVARGTWGGVLAEPGGCQDGGRPGAVGSVGWPRQRRRPRRPGLPAGGSSPSPAAARMAAGLALLVASAAVAIAIAAAAVVACGGTTSRVTRFWDALVTPIVWASIWRNQPTR